MNPRIFIGPMTKNVVDGAIQFERNSKIPIAFIPSRRQVDYDGGYVNNWTTSEFTDYVRSKSDAIIVRDHAGPLQGKSEDDGVQSLLDDCKHMDVVHIDPWKLHKELSSGTKATAELIKTCHAENPEVEFEVGTEQSIRNFEVEEIEYLLHELNKSLTNEEFSKVKYLVIQSGTSLSGNNQTGKYSDQRLREMLAIAKKYGMITKEHNGDYIEPTLINKKFEEGLDCINIAPEFGLIETDAYLEKIKDEETFELLWKICLESGKWIKWVDKQFRPEDNKKELIRICGHYVVSTDEFGVIKERVGNIDQIVADRVEQKLRELYGLQSQNNNL